MGGAVFNAKSGGWWRDMVLTYNTLGIVFGGVATSPLYVFNSLIFKAPPTEQDYLGIFGVMFWTLTLIGIVKYVCIALNADDHGEGGTFALYSLLCKHANISILSSPRSDLPTSDDNTLIDRDKTKLQRFLEGSMFARRVLLFISILGLCMLIGDGVLTPAISVLSAIDGLRTPFPVVTKGAVEALSAVILISLFLLQMFGTARVSFLFSPIMASWALSTPLIGIYNICRHYPGVFKALSPYYVFHFFFSDGKEAWRLLGGIVLVITGAEAMFADLGHFNKRSIRMAFVFIIYPSLVLTYAGQTAYLIKNTADYTDGFYKFIPHPVYWPMFVIATLAAIVASQSLISASFSVIKQSVLLDYFPRVKILHTSKSKEGEVYSPEINYILMILCIAVVLGFGDGSAIGNAYGLVVIFVMLITSVLLTTVMIVIWRTPVYLALLYFIPFFSIESVYVSAVLTKFLMGGWFPFAISIFLAIIMFSWYYGRQRKLEYEHANKITTDHLSALLSRSEVIRVPGLCIFYSAIQDGMTPILGHYLKNLRSMHSVVIFTTLKYLMVPKVDPSERVVITRTGLAGVYGCLVRYGYADLLSPDGDDLVTLVTSALKTYIEENPAVEEISPEAEICLIEKAKEQMVVHVHGNSRLYVDKKKSGWFDRVLIRFYEFQHSNCRSALPTLGIPIQQKLEIGMLYTV